MKNQSIYRVLPLALMLGLGAMTSCTYNQPDEPPMQRIDRSNLPLPTHTIAQLKALYQQGGVVLDKPIVVSAYVSSDDTEGNLYKTCYLQDETGGIELKVAFGNLSTLYPQGTRVRLLCQGLTLGTYGGQVNLGGKSTDARYETGFALELDVPNRLLKEDVGLQLQPRDLTIATLDKQYAGTLIRLSGVQFLSSEAGSTYADAQNKEQVRNVERHLIDASGRQVIVRTSSYAKFAGKVLPAGSGSVTAILTYFRDTPQLLLLKEADVQLNEPRF